jgi:hypothetical protein
LSETEKGNDEHGGALATMDDGGEREDEGRKLEG